MTDISNKIRDITWRRGAGDGEERIFDLVISLLPVDFPESTYLIIVVSVPVRHETVLSWDFPALRKNNIRDYFIDSLNFFKSAYRKEGLRGMLFSDEIGVFNKTFFMWMYEDFNEDTTVMKYFHRWLKNRFGSVENLNQYLGTNYAAIEETDWDVTPLPYESVGHLKEVEKPRLFGLYDSVEQVERRNSLQNDFIFWFYGHCYAEYARIAKEIIGDVPVFTTAWASQNSDPLRIHYEAMLEGVDGFVRNSYGQVVTDSEGKGGIGFPSEEGARLQDLRDIENMIERAGRECGYTKAYIANEFYWVQAAVNEDIEGSVQFKFPTRSDLNEFLKVLIDHGYRGFHMFIINPSDVYHSEDSLQREDIIWFSELKPEILGYMLGKAGVLRDVAITGLVASPTRASLGETISIEVTVGNQGNYTETFTVSVYYMMLCDPLIGEQNVTLAAGTSTSLTFEWVPNVPGRYEVRAEAKAAFSEVDTVDNTYAVVIHVE